ncbi:hypothetical protein M409DRAFT_65849 [Zasmidium cellare ATCC 36951]|uniref:Uncharacterized protein n=1 Tax=Zasmidium cellare ATCC 36951 TaxID=1080233 RepID=A0A6A6CPP9_ZASCE|nr:uncharacterized protein M409DRAFT_65849 [Zasmidium cellare ATCC 36951]KAF2167739.1 hypothetical protein M409DRAFT_65849 [Zasmidium cellare ATCC 36951]
MAKDAERKRKLEQDQEIATPKRLKQSKGDPAKKAGSKINGESTGSPMVVISRTESKESSKQTPRPGSAAGNKSSGSAKRSNSTSAAKPAIDNSTSSTSKKHSQDVKQEEGVKSEVEESANTPSSAKSSKKKKKRKSAQQSDLNASEQRKRDKKARRSAQRMVDVGLAENEQLTAPNQHGWWLSAPGAGHYLDHDPIFVEDDFRDKYLIAATNREIQLLSLDSSLVVRKHVVPDGRSIVCYSLSPGSDDCVDVAYDNGTKVQWNWMTSELVKGTFPGQETTVAMTVTEMDDGREELFYIARSRGDYTVIGERKSLYTTERRLKSIQVLQNGWYIICVSATALTIGARKAFDKCDYIWVDIPVEKPIRCADARLLDTDKKQGRRPDLAVAVGDTEGQVHLYSNVSSVFATPSQAKLPPPRYLHWHREPVSAIKFSKDGNYILSGGKETVLVIWQLETGRQQFLPHLTAEIERIVVSADGTRYALQMGDNSIMVLSSSELKPVANVAGLQLPISTEKMEAEGIYLPGTTAVLHPKDPHQLLLSVPATQPKTALDVAARPFLQSFDIRNARHISRQALGRNNVTDLSVGPEKTPVIPPDVNLLAVSADGKWLTTVDEWFPPASDLEHIVAKTTGLDAHDVQELRERQQHKREIHVKFWRWNEASNTWTLSTRADSPHMRFKDADPGKGGGTILKLVSDPASNCFATIGADSNVKIWVPKLRTKFGQPLKEQDGTDSVNWVCQRTIPIPASANAFDRADSPMDGSGEKTADVTDAALVFSPDGSMLACANGSADENALPLVHFVSPTTGALIATKTGLVAAEQAIVDFGFSDHYFVSLSTGAVRVWNLIDDSHQYTIALSGRDEDQEDAMLAINHFDETFAVISHKPSPNTDALTPKVEVYSPKQTVCLFETDFVAEPAKILAGNGVKGYTILFEDGTIRTLYSATPTARPKQDVQPPPEQSSALAVAQQQDEDVEMADSDTFGLSLGEYTSTAAIEDDRPVVRPEHLAEIFDTGNSLGLPPVRDMFQAVVGLYARKPRHVDSDAMEVEVV